MQKRFEVRRSTIIPTEVMAPYWNDSLDLVAADLSPRGMYLLSEDMPQIGEYLFCSFALHGEDPEYSFFSRVQRVNWHRRKTERMRPGFGVEFLDVPEEERGAAFDRLRKEYPRRREFFNTRAAVAPPNIRLEAMLSGIGFRCKAI